MGQTSSNSCCFRAEISHQEKQEADPKGVYGKDHDMVDREHFERSSRR